MIHNLGLAVILLCFWAAIFFGGLYLMTNASGHAVVDAALKNADNLQPLNQRIKGYGKADAEAVWKVIADTPGGPEAERAFLRLDLAYPLLYGGALAFIMVVMLRTVGAGRYGAVFLAPVAVAVFADWTENTIHLKQFARSLAGNEIGESAIRIASVATSVKLILIFASLAMIVLLAFLFQPSNE